MKHEKSQPRNSVIGLAAHNISYTLFSNVLSFVISACVSFVIPKFLSIEEYGYFQLYLFYANYIGFLHLGWADGILLRFGGEYYDELNKRQFSAQFWLYTVIVTLLGIFLCGIGISQFQGYERSMIIAMTGIAVIVHLPRTLLQYILQATNRIKEYARLTITEKITYIIFVGIFIGTGLDSFKFIIAADLLGKFSALCIAIFECRDLVMALPTSIGNALGEARNNISVGSKLMFANIASSLIIGVVRFAIERKWDVGVFGKVAFTISVSNMMMVAIRAVALVLFPILKRLNQKDVEILYKKMRIGIVVPLLGMLVIYYPVKVVLGSWLPSYMDSLTYMALLFPMCVFESKMSMLVETYMKTLRMEKQLLSTNLFTVFISILSTVCSVFVFENIDLAVLSIVLLLMFRSTVGEIIVSKRIHIKLGKDIILEIILTVVFMLSSWFVGGIYGCLIYFFAYSIYLVLQRKQLKAFVESILSYTFF